MTPQKTWFKTSRYGLFATYSLGTGSTPGTVYFDGSAPSTIDDLAGSFNDVAFARDLHAFRVTYVVFTIMPHPGALFYPSDILSQYKGAQSTKRDVIADLIAALRQYDIKLIIDLPVANGGDMPANLQTATGWNSAGNSYKGWNDYLNAVVTEIGLRYTAGVAGYWIEPANSPFDLAKIDVPRLSASCLGGDPDRILVTGSSSLVPALPYDATFQELSTEVSSAWTTSSNGSLINITTGKSWASVKQGQQVEKYTANELFRYLVLEAACTTTGGGTLLSAGPYAGAEGGWEDGVESALRAVGKTIRSNGESLEDVVGSRSYPIKPETTFATVSAGFSATESPDGKFEYIHVLQPPTGLTLQLPAPNDNVLFSHADLLSNHHKVTITQSSSGVSISLLPPDSWDPVDTVIKVDRTGN